MRYGKITRTSFAVLALLFGAGCSPTQYSEIPGEYQGRFVESLSETRVVGLTVSTLSVVQEWEDGERIACHANSIEASGSGVLIICNPLRSEPRIRELSEFLGRSVALHDVYWTIRIVGDQFGFVAHEELAPFSGEWRLGGEWSRASKYTKL